MPFPGGQAVRIIQGYNGGTHQGRSRYGLDLVLASGATSGAAVVSPIDGRVAWAFAPGSGNGCIAISLQNGSHSVMLCHVILNRAYQRSERVARGQSLGKVGPPGTVGNNGTPHVHLELHGGGTARSPVPFSPPAGLSLEGVELPASTGYNQHGSRRGSIVSTNGASAAPPVPSNASQARPPEAAPRPAPSERSEPRPAPQPRQTPAPKATPEPRTAAPAAPPAKQPDRAAMAPSPPSPPSPTPPPRAAVVRGTDSCLTVRAEPSLEGTPKRCLPDGTEVSLSGEAPRESEGHRWWEIEGIGWVVTDYLARTRAAVASPDDCLNVRERPSTDAPVVLCVPDRTQLTLVEGPTTGEGFTWYRIDRAGAAEQAGWIVDQYLD